MNVFCTQEEKVMLDKEFISIFTEKTITHLLTNEDLVSLTGLGKKRLTDNIIKVNSEFLIDSKDTVDINHFDLSKIDKHQLLLDFSKSYVLLDDYRRMLLYLLVFIQKEAYSILELQSVLDVSRNTVISDLKKLNQELDGVKVEYNRKEGYELIGNELDIRKYALYYIFILYKELEIKTILLEKLDVSQETFRDWLKETHRNIKKNQLNIMTGQLSEIVIFILLISLRKEYTSKSKHDSVIIFKKYLPAKNYLNFSHTYVDLFSEQEELNYISILFAAISQEDVVDDTNQLNSIFYKFVTMLNVISGINILNDPVLITRLKNHSMAMIYREKFFYFIKNDLIKQIAKENEALTNVIKEALAPIEEEVQKEISLTEIGYLVAIIESYLQNKTEPFRLLRAVILCPNGTTSSILLKKELEELFPSIQFSKVSSISNFKEIDPGEYDIIFSTIPIHTQKPSYVISNFLSNFEKQKLKSEIHDQYDLPSLKVPSFREVELLIHDYHINNQSMDDLYSKLVKIITQETKDQGECAPVLKELLNEDTIEMNVEATDWEDAIRKSGEILVDTKVIQDSYVEAMVDSVKKYGSYIVITPHIALAHASSHDGVNRVGFSLITLKNEIEFNHEENDPVKVVITLAATDQSTHLKALSELMDLLGHEEFLNLAYDPKTSKVDIIDLINKL